METVTGLFESLGAGVPTVGIRDAEDLPTMLGFASFADGRTPLSALEVYMQARVRGFLDDTRVRS